MDDKLSILLDTPTEAFHSILNTFCQKMPRTVTGSPVDGTRLSSSNCTQTMLAAARTRENTTDRTDADRRERHDNHNWYPDSEPGEYPTLTDR